MSDNSNMDKDAYIKLLEAKIADLEQRMVLLEKRNQQLERRLGINSQNSKRTNLRAIQGCLDPYIRN